MTELSPEQQGREAALYAVYRMTQGDESLDACDVLDLAEYVRSGVRGLPVVECARCADAVDLDAAIAAVNRTARARTLAGGALWGAP